MHLRSECQPFRSNCATGNLDESAGTMTDPASTAPPIVPRSRDPIGFEGSPWNLYKYCNSNPLSAVDPDGELWWVPIPVIIVSCIVACLACAACPKDSNDAVCTAACAICAACLVIGGMRCFPRGGGKGGGKGGGNSPPTINPYESPKLAILHFPSGEAVFHTLSRS
ncbi:hypothetical protein Pla52n_41060 [Stieleria varia]|uniref:Uncharacterized protein n=1 Tax=Stieleria varia TaxID=2528005 RepID=A0A5C6AU66_9BACT|nr:hypothetical protein Pla52n_41060 [Stieleria varia]